MLRVILVIAGTLLLALGIIGIVVPGLPTTPFLLVAAACYFRSSQRLYNWLLSHRLFGKYIKRFRERKAMTVKSKILAISMMTAMITLSVVLFIDSWLLRYIVIGAGLAGLITILIFPTWIPEDHRDEGVHRQEKDGPGKKSIPADTEK